MRSGAWFDGRATPPTASGDLPPATLPPRYRIPPHRPAVADPARRATLRAPYHRGDAHVHTSVVSGSDRRDAWGISHRRLPCRPPLLPARLERHSVCDDGL